MTGKETQFAGILMLGEEEEGSRVDRYDRTNRRLAYRVVSWQSRVYQYHRSVLVKTGVA